MKQFVLYGDQAALIVEPLSPRFLEFDEAVRAAVDERAKEEEERA